MKYISPSGLACFERDKDEFYLRYLAKNRPPRSPQTLPMAIGSAFDAFIKSWLHERIYGEEGEFNKEKIFEMQVENYKKEAWVAGERVFDAYKKSGALGSLMSEMKNCIYGPRFEFSLLGDIEGIPILGKPDLFFIDSEGQSKVIDWKVNGYEKGASPKAGYIWLFDSWRGSEGPPSRGANAPHPKVTKWGTGAWADQLSIYAWLLGRPIGSDTVLGIDQIVGKKLRIAKHRFRVSEEYQFELLYRLKIAWSWVCNHPGNEKLEKMAEALTANDPFTEFVNEISR